jgi:hypothetical protein
MTITSPTLAQTENKWEVVPFGLTNMFQSMYIYTFGSYNMPCTWFVFQFFDMKNLEVFFFQNFRKICQIYITKENCFKKFPNFTVEKTTIVV